MTDTITLTGLVATQPKHLITSEGLPITSFRLASTQRRFDRSQDKWIDGETNWYTVTAFRQLAVNVVTSLQKGQRIVVTGRLRIRDWNTGEKSGTNIEIDADGIGHDLAWGTSVFSRSITLAAAESAGAAEATEAAVPRDEDAPQEEERHDDASLADADETRAHSLESLPVPF
jgi:single-strand DNA-binding protein